MPVAFSLKLRLLFFVLIPLLVIVVLLIYWYYNKAQHTAQDAFDRTLLSSALAILRDVALTEGDALLPFTRSIINSSSGGEVFYHVTGPNGVYITGYAYPPRTPNVLQMNAQPFHYFTAQYKGEPVRVLQITDVSHPSLFDKMTVRVWQRTVDREIFAQSLALRGVVLICILLMSLALLVWFGIGYALRPLKLLRRDIEKRSADDLQPINAPVLSEMTAIVATLNTLFQTLQTSIAARQTFVSDVAHQLKNPIAGLLATAEVLEQSTSTKERTEHIQSLMHATQELAKVTEQLLALEHVQDAGGQKNKKTLDVNQLMQDACLAIGDKILKQGVTFEVRLYKQPLFVHVNGVFVIEAMKNLLDNALQHGGSQLQNIIVTSKTHTTFAVVSVWNDGKSLSLDVADIIFERFVQLDAHSGSGLGLAIADTVAKQCGGQLSLDKTDKGTQFSLWLPLEKADNPTTAHG